MASRFVRLLRSVLKPKSKTYIKPYNKRSSRMNLEQLESRIAPATFTWDGGGVDADWSTPENWVGDVAPLATQASDDSLIFPSGTAVLATNNDFIDGFFNSIQFTGNGYTLSGNTFTLGNSVNVNPSVTNNVIDMDLHLAGGAGVQQFFDVASGGTLSIDGSISYGTAPIPGVGISKEGSGTLILNAGNSDFTGEISVKAGTLQISNADALGDTIGTTTVLANAQLRLAGNIGTINENLLLNGPGVANSGALLNAAGDNIWAGIVTLDIDSVTPVFIGASAGTSLQITGEITDLGAGQDLTKEGPGQLILSNENTYRGRTTVADGVLTIQHPLALGVGGTAANNTVVNRSNAGKVATLQIEDPDPLGTGFTVLDELLTLNDTGVGGQGALNNIAGNNTWAADVTLGSVAPNGANVRIGVAEDTSLTISGVVGNPNGPFSLTKSDLGTLILNNANTYNTPTTVAAGILNIRDSQALGTAGGSTSVASGAALELEVDTGFDAHGRNLADDSIMGFDGNSSLRDGSQLGLRISTPEMQTVTIGGDPNGSFRLTFRGFATPPLPATATATQVENALNALPPIDGSGGNVSVTKVGGVYTIQFLGTLSGINHPQINAVATGGATETVGTIRQGAAEFLTISGTGIDETGALRSLSGVNEWVGNISMSGLETAIGVDPDPAPSNTVLYFERDYSLTISGNLDDNTSAHNFRKRGDGHMIFPNSNSFAGDKNIEEGWITIRDNGSLGPLGFGSDVSQTQTIVHSGAALHLIPPEASATGELIHEYTLNGTFTDTFGGPSLVPNGGVIGPTNYTFGPGQGLTLSNALPDPTNYSIEMIFSLDEVSPTFNYAALIDFKNRTSDRALYNFNGRLDFFPSPSGPGPVFSDNVPATVLLTRDGTTGEVIGYVNGVEQWRFDDSATQDAVFTGPNAIINFVQDNITGPFPGEEVGGMVDNIRIFDGPVTPQGQSNNFNLVKNLDLSGRGITHPFPLISQKGSLMSLGGDNTIGGPVGGRSSFITLDEAAAIGVESIGFGSESELTITAPMSGGTATTLTFDISPSGGAQEDSQVLETTATSGTITVTYDMLFAPDQLRIYYPPRGEPGSTLLHDTGFVSGVATIVVPYGPGPSTEIEIVMNEGGTTPGTIWFYSATVVPDVTGGLSGLTKLGSKQLILQSEGSFIGDVNINEGVVLAQHDTALGLASSGTSGGNAQNTVEEYTTTNTRVNRGIAEVQVIDVSAQVGLGDFTLEFDGESTGPLSPTATAADVQMALNALTTIADDFGSVTVNRAADIFTVVFEGVLRGTDVSTLVASGNVTVDTLVDGDGAALRIGGLFDGSNIWHEHLHLQGTGNNEFNVGALSTTAFDNLWQGPVTLTDDANLEIPQGSRLIFRGPIDDAANTSPTGSNLTLIGGGEITLANANSYRGTTIVQDGVLVVQNSLALGTDSSPEVQTVTIDGDLNGTFTLEFNGETTAPISATATAPDVAAALNALPTIGGVGGLAVVTLDTNIYTISLQRALSGFDQTQLIATGSGGTTATVGTLIDGHGGTFVPAGSSLQIQGNLAIGAETLRLEGQGKVGTTNLPLGWFNLGPSPVNAFPSGPVNQAVSGRITGVVVDPGNSDVMFISTAGGGAWKTNDGGANWTPLFDHRNGQAEVQQFTVTGTAGTFTLTFDGHTTTPLAFDASARQVEEALNNLPSIGGAYGAVLVTKAGNIYTVRFTGTLSGVDLPEMTAVGAGGASVVVSTVTPGISADRVMFIGAIAMHPNNPRTIYIGTGEANNTTNGFYGTGVYRSTDSGNTWSPVLDTATTPGTPFNPFNGRAISKIIVDPNNPGRLFVASGDRANNATTGNAGVWRFQNNQWLNLTGVVSANRLGTASNQTNPAPVPNPPGSPGPDDDYRISFPSTNATWSDVAVIYTSRNNAGGDFGPVVYAALGSSNGGNNNGVFWSKNPESPNPIWYVGAPGGTNQNPAVAPTNVDVRSNAQFPTGVSSGTANGNIKVAAFAGSTLINTTVYASTALANGNLRAVYRSTNGGHNWSALTTPDFMSSEGDYANAIVAANASTVYVAGFSNSNTNHVLTSTDSGGAWTDISTDGGGVGPRSAFHALAFNNNTLLAANDSGLWRLENNGSWTNLTGNLTVAQVNGVASHPNDLTIAYAGLQSNGIAQFSDNRAWESVNGSGGGQVRVDPQNPNNVYAVQLSQTGNAVIRRSTNGGTSWSTVFNANRPVVPLFLDSINTSRLLVGGSTLFESQNGGNSFLSLGAPIGPTAIAAASFQGEYVLDPAFTHVADKGSNTYDPDTIYVTNGNSIFLSKDHGLTWANRTTNLSGMGGLSDLIIDPRNRDTVYVVRNVFGGNKVFRTTDAGRTWTNVNFDLPNIPVWSVVLDPRTDDVYIGTDLGVWRLPAGTSSWERFGNGLANVQVRDLDFNKAHNTLLAGTYGRGVYQLFLDNTEPNAGALRSVSGISTWDGPVVMVGDTTITVDGRQILDSNVLAAQLTLIGTVSDDVVDADHTLTKRGGGDLILSGSNIYGGHTNVEEGVLAVKNAQALGASDEGTTVFVGAAVELQSDLDAEPITLNGDGQRFNDRDTGALRNFTGNNVYTGPLTLNTNSTIGTDSGSSLTITGIIDDGANTFNLTKELAGTLILASDNTYGGVTRVNRGALRVTSSSALGTLDNGTEVLDGAQLQLAGDVTVGSEHLRVSGTGIFNTGAILNTSGHNTWQGNVTFDFIPNFAPPTNPPNFVSIGVAGGSSLTIDGVIEQDTTDVGAPANFGLTKINTGTLILTQGNTYGGVTTVQGGILNIQHGGALGTAGVGPNNGTVVNNGAALELEFTTGITVTGEGISIRGSGPGGMGALRNADGDNEIASGITMQAASTVQAAAGTSLTISGVIGQSAPSTLTKVGDGTVVLEAVNTYTGITNIDAGVLLVDGQIGDVLLRGGTLGGSGTVGDVTSGIAGGTVAPGASPGILNADDVTWNTATTFFVELNGTTAGTDYDQLQVNTIDLGNATLDGTVDASVPIGATFTIISAATSVTGTFDGLADGDKFALGGRIAEIDYQSNAVIITIVQDDTTTTLASSANPSVFGQDVILTATVTSDISGGSPTGTVTFDVTGDATFSDTVAVNSGVATFDVLAFLGNPLAVGSYNVTATYNGDISFTGSTSDPLTQVINQASTTTTITPSSNPSVFGEPVSFTVTVAPVAPGGGIPTGTVDFLNGSTIIADDVPLDGSGQATFNISNLPVGTHTISAEYSGDSNFIASSDSIDQVVNQAVTTTTLVAAPNPSVFGQTVTFTVTVTPNAPGGGTPTGTVDILDGTTIIADDLLLDGSGQASFNISSLSVGTHAISAEYSGDSNFTASMDSLNQVVNQAATTTTLTSTNNPSDFGESVTFDVTVAAVAPGAGIPTGTVTFLDGSTVLGTDTLDGSGAASFTISTLTAGTHNISAEYSGDTNFLTSSDSLSQVVNTADTTTTVVSSLNPSLPGDSVTFTATVTGTVTPTGTVDFLNGSTIIADDVPLLPNGTAEFTISTLPLGSHNITAKYSGNANLNPSTSTILVQEVSLGETTTVLVSSENPSVFGDPVTFTATVTGPETPTGTVDFLNGTTIIGANVPVQPDGTAEFTTSSLAFGSHNITAEYSGNSRLESSVSDVLVQQMLNSSTTTIASDLNPSTFGQSVTFTATVSASSGTPTGTVLFKEGTVTLGMDTLDGSGMATFTTNSLTADTHTIVAEYQGDANFVPSSSSVDQVVNQAATATTVVSAPDPSTFGQSVTFTVTVAALAPGSGTPTGTVTLREGTTVLGTDTLDGSGEATFTISSLTAGSHTITADYAGDTNFQASTDDVSQTVNQSGTTTTVVAAPSPSNFGQSVTFTATVAAVAPGAGTPTGSVTFVNGSTVLGTGTLNGSGQATLNISTLPAGTHTITANYTGDANFATSTDDVNQTVNQAVTTITLSSSSNPSFSGNAVTFVATVNGGANPTGTVTFRDGTTVLGTRAVSSRQASFTISTLTIGLHGITAEYSGDANHLGSVSNTVNQEVLKLLRPRIAVGADAGGGPHVRVYDPANGTLLFDFFAYDPNFLGGVRVATADITGDGADDIITAAGPTGGPHIKVFDGATGELIRSFFAYAPTFTGGVYVAGGDVNGDGFADIITGADAGGGPHVQVFDGRTTNVTASFFAYAPTFTGGVRVAAGDFNGDRRDDIVTGAGPSGGPHVRVIDAARVNQTNFDGTIAGSAVMRDLFVYQLSYTAGVFVSAGDRNGDGIADIGISGDITAPVRVFDGRTGVLAIDFFPAFNPPPISSAPTPAGTLPKVRTGIVSDSFGNSQIIVGQGAEVRTYEGGTLALLDAFFAFDPNFVGGMFVGV